MAGPKMVRLLKVSVVLSISLFPFCFLIYFSPFSSFLASLQSTPLFLSLPLPHLRLFFNNHLSFSYSFYLYLSLLLQSFNFLSLPPCPRSYAFSHSFATLPHSPFPVPFYSLFTHVRYIFDYPNIVFFPSSSSTFIYFSPFSF